ncbi:hypothetical protein HY971_01245 [Candidatus Kaiserbacteria bacterium]|nr:hypothetical protein [Candidatus Kaiserbacteria bacterium]
MISTLKKPGAWIPIALSLGMLAFILTYVAMFGVAAPDPNADEGTPAHLFQLWLVLEALMIPFFCNQMAAEGAKGGALRFGPTDRRRIPAGRHCFFS